MQNRSEPRRYYAKNPQGYPSAVDHTEVDSVALARRRPVYDRAGAVVGYELWFGGPGSAAEETLTRALAGAGLRALTGDRLRLLALPAGMAVPVPPGAAVLVVPAGGPAEGLAARGHRVAVGPDGPLDVASYVRLDLAAVRPERVGAAVDRVRRYPHLAIIAAELGGRAHLAQARRLGCELFSGPVLAQPGTPGAPLSPARLRRVELIAALAGGDLRLDEILATATRDPAVAYRLQRAAGAVAAPDPVEVSPGPVAVPDPVVVSLGPDRLGAWLALILLQDATGADEGQLSAALTRARFCQLGAVLAALPGAGAPGDPAFTAGLLTGVAEIVGRPVADLVDGLPLPGDVADALRGRAGPIGAILDAVLAYEAGDADGVRAATVPSDGLTRAYLDAAAWALAAVDAVAVPPGRAQPVPNVGSFSR